MGTIAIKCAQIRRRIKSDWLAGLLGFEDLKEEYWGKRLYLAEIAVELVDFLKTLPPYKKWPRQANEQELKILIMMSKDLAKALGKEDPKNKGLTTLGQWIVKFDSELKRLREYAPV